MDMGPRTGGSLPKVASGPQSGVFTSSLGGADTALLTMPIPLQLVHLPLAGDSVTRIRCDGILTLRGRPTGSDPLRELLGPKAFAHPVLMSLEKIVGAETSGISWLYQTGERFAQGGGKLSLYAVPPQVLSLFELLEMELPFKIAASEAEALAAITEQPKN